MINHQEIAALIPHQGDMCLLYSVIEWDKETIVCHAQSHRDQHNPLRCAGRLGIATVIEYAAQAMAVHAALCTDGRSAPKAGLLTSARDVRWYRQQLSDIDQPLTIRAHRLSSSNAATLYTFEIYSGERLASGRISAILDATPFTSPP